MKSIGKIDQKLGEQGSVGGELKIEGADLVAEVNVQYKYPIAKVIEPVMSVVDGLIDKIEALIPGDQKALAATLKAEARADVVKLLSEKPAEAV